MPTPEQVEAVARAIEKTDEDTLDYERRRPDMHPSIPDDAPGWMVYQPHALAAIAAYERTRPAVPSDDELVEAYEGARISTLRSLDQKGISGRTVVHQSALAGIRAVRERLAGVATEIIVTDDDVLVCHDAYHNEDHEPETMGDAMRRVLELYASRVRERLAGAVPDDTAAECTHCHGTGVDPDFGCACMECWDDATQIAAAMAEAGKEKQDG